RRQSGVRPALYRRRERVLDRLFGEVDVTEDTDQDGHRATVLGPEDALDLRTAHGRPVRHQYPASPWNGRTSIGSCGTTRASRRPHSSAASRSVARMTVTPPRCSLPSVYGPSVTSMSPSRYRTTVAVPGSCSPPPNTHTPASFISRVSASTSRMIG